MPAISYPWSIWHLRNYTSIASLPLQQPTILQNSTDPTILPNENEASIISGIDLWDIAIFIIVGIAILLAFFILWLLFGANAKCEGNNAQVWEKLEKQLKETRRTIDTKYAAARIALRHRHVKDLFEVSERMPLWHGIDAQLPDGTNMVKTRMNIEKVLAVKFYWARNNLDKEYSETKQQLERIGTKLKKLKRTGNQQNWEVQKAISESLRM